MKKNYKEALDDFADALKVNPRSVTAYLDRANLLMTKNTALINPSNIKAVAKPPGTLTYPTNPLKEWSRDEILSAIKDCDAAIAIDPRNPQAYFSRAQANIILNTGIMNCR